MFYKDDMWQEQVNVEMKKPRSNFPVSYHTGATFKSRWHRISVQYDAPRSKYEPRLYLDGHRVQVCARCVRRQTSSGGLKVCRYGGMVVAGWRDLPRWSSMGEDGLATRKEVVGSAGKSIIGAETLVLLIV